MKYIVQGILSFPGKIKSLGIIDLFLHFLLRFQEKIKAIHFAAIMRSMKQQVTRSWKKLRTLGFTGVAKLSLQYTTNIGRKIIATDIREVPAQLHERLI
ncbi:MAG TPA: hypothetical protein VD996_00160, partial [Chitinophagaceae bacterium]|nr:hypothetical protein [Chitinophagaceae bacterium]